MFSRCSGAGARTPGPSRAAPGGIPRGRAGIATRGAPRALRFDAGARSRVAEAIAHAAHGLDRVARRAELLAQALDVRVDGARLDARRVAPDPLEERVAALHPAAT